MAKRKRNREQVKKAGLLPGTLVYTGQRMMESVKITVMDYDEQNFHEKQVQKIEDCFEFKTKPTVTWINIDGLHDAKIIEKIGNHYDIHPLVLEDILHIGQRPKFNDLEKYIFVVLMMLHFDEASQTVQSEQISFVLGSNYLISFQENIGDVFDQIRDRIRNAKGKIRKMNHDYLLYSLLDAIVDSYFSILEKLGEKIESLEEELSNNPEKKTLQQIHNLKREMIFLRKSVWPLRELISSLQRSESELIKDSTKAYLKDIYDHTIQVIDSIDSFRDIISSIQDLYLSIVSNRMNEVMKVLTIIATIFIPLTFIAGVYGMNFDNIPELRWKYGYAAVLLMMIAVSAGMLYYFKRNKWL
ncbi:MAG: magnesium/cobalt transporter CorA [Sedimentisphaerales bacterium]|nr:magnesium/cobalt transporter CorA [Sedimentisphaerales bacterium]